MWGNIRLGKLFGIEVRLDYSWFLVFFLLAWSLSVRLFPGMEFAAGTSWVMGIIAALLLFASVLAHEISHSLMARHYGADVSAITLFLFGGVAQLRGEPRTPKQEFMITIVGPITSVVIGGICMLLAWLISLATGLNPVTAVLSYLGVINVILAVFNLIPGFPLDGGRILRSAVWHQTGNLRKATRWAATAGKVFAWLLIGYGLIFRVLLAGDLGGLWLVFIGWFLNSAAQAEYQQLLLRQTLRGVPVEEVMERNVPMVDAGLPVSQFVNDYLLRFDHAVYPVQRDGEFAGLVTLEDVKGLDRRAWNSTPVGGITDPADAQMIVEAQTDTWEVLTRMLENDATRLLVTDEDGHLVGAVSRSAIVQLMQRKLQLGLGEPEDVRPRRVGTSRTRGFGT